MREPPVEPATGGDSFTGSQILALLAPVAIAVAGYARSLRGEFLYDDVKGIAANGAIKSFGAWLRWVAQPETFVSGRPLTQLTFAANYAVGRLDPLGYHAVNLGIHLFVVALLGLLTLRVATLSGAERPRWIAVAVAGLFAVHPLQSEAVSYVSQRAESLASALYVATLLLLLRPLPMDGRRPWGRWAVALATFMLGLAAKPIPISLPVVFLAILLAGSPAAAPGPNADWRRRLPVLTAIGIAAAAFAIALLASLRGRADAGFGVAGTSPWLYFLTQLRALVVYLRLLVWPVGQSADPAFPTSPGLADPATLGAAAVILAVAAAAVLLLVRGRRHATPGGASARLAGLGLAWFFIVISVTSSFIPLADNLAEHRAYLASWGILLAAVVAADSLSARLGLGKATVAAYLVAVLVLGVALFRRNEVWESEESLWSDVVEKAPMSARGRMSLGHAYAGQGRWADAIQQYELALPHAAHSPWLQAQILRNLGSAHFAEGRMEAARLAFEAGLQAEPRNDELLVNLAFLSSAAGDVLAAEQLARRALEVRAEQPVAWLLLGNLALARSNWNAALDAYDRAAAIDPDRGEAHYNRSLALRMLGRKAEECAALRAALLARLVPADRAVAAEQAAARCR